MNQWFENKGLKIGEIVFLSPCQAAEAIENGAVLVDIREDFEIDMKAFAVDRILFCANGSLKSDFHSLPLNKPLIIADSVGLHSKPAALFLLENGFTDVAVLNGGIADWERDGFPLLSDASQRLSGQCMCQLKPREKKK